MANIVKAGCELIKQRDVKDALKHIERIGRVCYKSEDKIAEGTDKKFFDMIKGNGHTAMFEHANVVFGVTGKLYNKIMDYRDERGNTFFKCTKHLVPGEIVPRYLVSANIRAISNSGIYELLNALYEVEPDLVYAKDFKPTEITIGDLHCVVIYDLYSLKNLSDEEMAMHTYASIKFTCDRGVTHELVRHRPVSFAQESTRYCNYSKDKFGNSIAVIDIQKGVELNLKVQSMLKDGLITQDQIQDFVEEWERAVEDAEKHYFNLLSIINAPELARSVLPTSTKAEIIMTCNIAEWEWIAGLRTDKPAHPQMREVMIPAIELLKFAFPEYFRLNK